MDEVEKNNYGPDAIGGIDLKVLTDALETELDWEDELSDRRK